MSIRAARAGAQAARAMKRSPYGNQSVGKCCNPLLRAKNCIVTPHIAWATKEARAQLLNTGIDNVRAFLEVIVNINGKSFRLKDKRKAGILGAPTKG
jgi:phosphoglycerate dehydrogenase-like enzyme